MGHDRPKRLSPEARKEALSILTGWTLVEGREAMSKRFVFRDAAERLQGKRLQVSVSDSESAARLNATLVVP